MKDDLSHATASSLPIPHRAPAPARWQSRVGQPVLHWFASIFGLDMQRQAIEAATRLGQAEITHLQVLEALNRQLDDYEDMPNILAEHARRRAAARATAEHERQMLALRQAQQREALKAQQERAQRLRDLELQTAMRQAEKKLADAEDGQARAKFRKERGPIDDELLRKVAQNRLLDADVERMVIQAQIDELTQPTKPPEPQYTEILERIRQAIENAKQRAADPKAIEELEELHRQFAAAYDQPLA